MLPRPSEIDSPLTVLLYIEDVPSKRLTIEHLAMRCLDADGTYRYVHFILTGKVIISNTVEDSEYYATEISGIDYIMAVEKAAKALSKARLAKRNEGVINTLYGNAPGNYTCSRWQCETLQDILSRPVHDGSWGAYEEDLRHWERITEHLLSVNPQECARILKEASAYPHRVSPVQVFSITRYHPYHTWPVNEQTALQAVIDLALEYEKP
jgi:hypothetical protein